MMTIQELSNILSTMYENADDGEKVAMIYLFGVKYSSYIRENGYVPSAIINNTRLSNGKQMSGSYSTELNKAIKLAKYVICKE